MIAVIYPLIPWVGVMAVGYAFGALYQLDAQRRRRLLLIIGGAATALFIVIRAIDIYGDPSEWSQQKNFVYTVLSFLNTTKYPPSLLFLLMTLGPSILALALFESTNFRRCDTTILCDFWTRAAVLLSAAVVHGTPHLYSVAPRVW